MAIDKHEQIRHRAYEIWEAEGRPDGADQRHWLQACDELAGEDEHETPVSYTHLTLPTNREV